MIAEYAIIPDVFGPSAYPSDEVCNLRLQSLRDCLMGRGVVRNLHGGSWCTFLESHRDKWHQRAKELIKKLKQQGRLTDCIAHAGTVPANGVEWCQEALHSHAQSNLTGIISDEITSASFEGNSLVAAVTKLPNADWWIGHSVSLEVKRTSVDYLQALQPVLRHSNSLMFIDAHIDPSERRYDSIKDLLRNCGTTSAKPAIEFHRVCYKGSGPTRHVPSAPEMRAMFASLTPIIRQLGLQAELFVWDDFHDRFLISNLIGILMSNGFDVDPGGVASSAWARLDREHRDQKQREFDPAANMHALRARFTL